VSVAPPRVAVMGAGAVGSYFGAALARAGWPVVLIGRAAHVAAIAREGLLVEGTGWDAPVRLEASTDAAAARGADLVLLTVKSGDTTAAAQALAPHLDAAAQVLCLQNGVDNAERAAAHLPCGVAPAIVYVAAGLAAPGRLRYSGRGDLVLGAWPAAPRFDAPAWAARLGAAGVPCRVSMDLAAELWMKLALNCAYNAVSALGRSDYGRMMAVPEVRALMLDAVAEVAAVARASGVALDGDAAREACLALAPSMPRQVSSTAQDLARGRPSEIDHLNGYVARRAAELSLDAPVNRSLHALVKLVEAAQDRA
jgi:2-dehydropantoate 2-reductase